MRRYRRLGITILVIGGFTIAFFPDLLQKMREWSVNYQQNSQLEMQKKTVRSITYELSESNWLQYPLPEDNHFVRILSNAATALTIDPDNFKGSYVIRYQVLSSDRKVLVNRLYYFRSQFSLFKGKHGEILQKNYYPDTATHPLDSQSMMINLTGLRNAGFIRLKLEQKDPPLTGVSVRLYIPLKIAQYKLKTQWERLSQEQKSRLAAGSVYPFTNLTDHEIRNLLKQQWQPLGPLGIEGKDFHSGTIYTLDVSHLERISDPILPEGIMADSLLPAIIPIPEKGGELTLELASILNDSNHQPQMMLAWRGRSAKDYWQGEWFAHSDSEKLSLTVEGGLLKLRSSEPVIVRAFLKTANQEKLEITPELSYLKSYRTDQPVIFQVNHVADKPTSIRLDLRKIIQPELNNYLEQGIQYKLLDQSNRMISDGTLNLSETLSLTDRFAGEQENDLLTETVSYYFELSDDVYAIQVNSGNPEILVNAYNQPAGFVRQSLAPESAYIDFDNKSIRIPAWFKLQPVEEEKLVHQHRMVLVTTQPGMREVDPDLMQDNYEWQDFVPQDYSEARYLLIEKKDPSEPRNEALGTYYCQLNSAKAHELEFQSSQGILQVQPNLIFYRRHPLTEELKVLMDGELALTASLMSSHGEFNLPFINAGKHRIKIDPKGPWLINYIKNCPGILFLKRRVFKAGHFPLRFVYDRQTKQEETLTLQFYSSAETDKRSKLDIEILPQKNAQTALNEPRLDKTFQHMTVDVRPNTNASSFVLNDTANTLNAGESVFIPIRQDLPAGRYIIQVSIKDGVDGYVSLSKITPGFYREHRFFQENNYENIEKTNPAIHYH